MSQNIECAECGVITSSDRADFVEGDGGMIPDRWFCHRCQALESQAADYEDSEDFDDAGEYDGDCRGEHCGVIGCPSCDKEYYENYPCGMGRDGQCSMAGSEDCDFECPVGRNL
jgi:hypothetical protein